MHKYVPAFLLFLGWDLNFDLMSTFQVCLERGVDAGILSCVLFISRFGYELLKRVIIILPGRFLN